MGHTQARLHDEVQPAQVDAVVDATRVVGALIAESLAELDPPLTMPQWRVLVLASEAPCNVTAVADDLRVHLSNATRLCDRLVDAGLLSRERSQRDRRHVMLTLTADGRRLHAAAMAHRRRRVERAMAHLDPEEQTKLADALTSLARALQDE